MATLAVFLLLVPVVKVSFLVTWSMPIANYEWNQRGGVLHWIHDDPKDWHAAGWLEHNGVRYE